MGETWAGPVCALTICLHWWERGGYLQQFGGWSNSTWTISRIPFLRIKVVSGVPVMDRIRFLCMRVFSLSPPILWDKK